MSGYRSRGGRDNRPHYPRPRDDFYDDRRSGSRSPPSRDAQPHGRSPPHDIPRGPARQYARGASYRRDHRDRSPRNYHDLDADRGDQSRGRSRSPRHRRRSDSQSHSRSRSRSRSRDSYGERASSRGRPSKEIVNELQQHYHVKHLDDVRIIRDRQTKQSRQFGFLRFSTLDEAEAFMDANYPTIYLYGTNDDGQNSDDAKVRISYGRERKDARAEETDWICKICNINNYATRARCFRCQSLRPEQPSNQKPANVGDNDAAPDNTPSQFLLLRGLESSVSEELLVKGVGKLNKPSGGQTQSSSQPSAKKGAKVASTTGDTNLGAKEGTLRRVLLVRDRKSNESWRYGFAEYASVDDAQAALTRYNSFDRFTIASRPVLVSYIHAGVFIPVLNPAASTDRFTFSPLGNPSVKLAYWDEEGYVTELAVSFSTEAATPTQKQPRINTESEGLKANKDVDKSKKRKAQDPSSHPSTAKKTTASHLQFWSSRHAELHGIKSKDNAASSHDASEPSSAAPPSRSYADPSRNCCYLCMRQFDTSAEVNKHERLSDLHRQNLKDEAKVARAEHKLEKHGVAQQTAGVASSEYRDRARERRKVYGVVNKKGEQINNNHASSAAKSGSKSALSGRDHHGGDDDPANVPVPSKGASLLSKMGYTAGQGLGASGEGRTEALTQDIYVAGVGLGAAGGKVGDAVKEAERNTKGDYKGFVERSREGARERYKNLD